MIVRPQSGGGLLDGEWELNLPVQLKGSATVTGRGSRIETWQRKIGLKKGYHKFPDHPGWEGTERFTQLRLEVDEAGAGGDLGLSGDYDLRPKCGTAQQSLHSCAANGLHLFFDPTRCGAASEDFYVVADTHRTLGYGESRGELVAFDPAWRAEQLTGAPAFTGPASIKMSVPGTAKVGFTVQGKWAATPPEIAAIRGAIQ